MTTQHIHVTSTLINASIEVIKIQLDNIDTFLLKQSLTFCVFCLSALAQAMKIVASGVI